MKPKPTTSILDRKFAYTPAAATTPEYLRRKFARIRREQKAEAIAAPAASAATVTTLRKAAKS